MGTGAWCDFSLHGTVFAKLLQCEFKMNTEKGREENKKKAPTTAKPNHVSLVCKFVWVCLYQRCLCPNPSTGQCQSFRWDIRGNLFMESVAGKWHRLPRELWGHHPKKHRHRWGRLDPRGLFQPQRFPEPCEEGITWL